jgi:preprotein translocase subunit YajC
MISAWIPFIVCIFGLVIFLFCFNRPDQVVDQNAINFRSKLTRVGEIIFAVGLFITLLHLPLPLIHGH